MKPHSLLLVIFLFAGNVSDLTSALFISMALPQGCRCAEGTDLDRNFQGGVWGPPVFSNQITSPGLSGTSQGHGRARQNCWSCTARCFSVSQSRMPFLGN